MTSGNAQRGRPVRLAARPEVAEQVRHRRRSQERRSSRAAGRRPRAAAARTGWSRRRRTVRCPELCGRGASSLTSSRPSRVRKNSTHSTPTTSSASSTARAISTASRATAGGDVGRRDRDVEDVVRVRVLDDGRSATSSPASAARRDDRDLALEVDERLEDCRLAANRLHAPRRGLVGGRCAPAPCRRSRSSAVLSTAGQPNPASAARRSASVSTARTA